jgi:predicted RNA polymerase sigma factor
LLSLLYVLHYILTSSMQIENSINKGVADLSTVVSTLNLVQTAGMRQDLQQAVAAVATAGVPLEVAQAEDVKVKIVYVFVLTIY